MSDKVVKLRERGPDSEKITINLGYVDLGRIDLLVQEGLLLEPDRLHQDGDPQPVEQPVGGGVALDRPDTLEVGLLELGAVELEAARAASEMLHVKVVGLVRIASDVTPELALQTIGSLTVLGLCRQAHRSRPLWPQGSNKPRERQERTRP